MTAEDVLSLIAILALVLAWAAVLCDLAASQRSGPGAQWMRPDPWPLLHGPELDHTTDRSGRMT